MLNENSNSGVVAARIGNSRGAVYAVRLSAICFLLALALVQSGCVGLTGSDSSGPLVFSPTSVDFGQVAAGSKKTITVTLTNTGNSTITLPQVTISPATFTFSGVTLPATLDPNGILTFTATFAPTAVGAVSGNATVATSDTSITAPSVALKGTGLSTTGPTILTQPVSQSVTIGQTATFSVSATGTNPITYQWKKNGTNISGATSTSYTTPAAATSDGGAQFTVLVTDAVGSVTSNAATLTVTATAVAPTISTQPANQTVVAGQTATFSVVASGTAPLSYQWKKNGANLSGATSANYTTPVTSNSDSGLQFSVVVTNAAGSVTSNVASLTVNTPVTITSQPASQSVTAGRTATFSVTATGSFSISYQWRKNGANITGATSSSYTTPATTASDNGSQFSVVLTSVTGSITSNTATLTVTAVPVAPAITTQPANRTVIVGQTTTFSVTTTGTTPMTYQWRKNGANVGGATGASYTTPATTTADNGAQFSSVVTNSVGTATSNNATLTVNTPVTITSQPAGQSLVAGQTATFSVTATGTSPITYQWTKNGANISGATAPSYTTPATATSDNGTQFAAIVTNPAGSVTSTTATLTVTAAPVAPSITSAPANSSVAVGQMATFSVTASGTSPLSYQWSKNGTNISGATGASYTTPAAVSGDNGAQFSVVVTNSIGTATSNAATLTVNTPVTITSQPVGITVTLSQTATFTVTATGTSPISYQWTKNGANISGATGTSYTTPATIASDSGAKFAVVVTNPAGNVTSSAATLTVMTPPSITSQTGNQTVVAGQAATFTVTATGTGPLSYQWSKNGASISGATGTSYTTPATTTADNGAQFSVVVTNSVGSATGNAATLTVNAATLTLTANPTSLTFGSVTVGSNKTLSVAVSNTGNSSVTVSSVGQSGAGISASGVSSGLVLTAGQTATLNVLFAPSGASSVTGSVTVNSNATNSPLVIAVTGSAVQPVQHTVTLSWTASTSTVTGYYAYRATNSGGPYTKLNSSATASMSYADSTVQSGSTYYYVVTAVDSNGVESSNSNQVSGIVPTP
jgi:hypothetical protein